ncbi:MAG: UvrD-helicase domain-containing protein [Thiobacillus sp.]|uniref:UvrD-helicase domain-containing protein n=1 Tax=Thiobacillus sp. TaxID=924 RepID=UPI0028951B4B|nr:UvrD-helicase domain-containing protein [Thiobacillus sp.]MDT3705919.1 UvrD-helicase domain-containing protein [Thiobacillus sp.]
MKYLYVDQEAAQELVSERTLQSAEFQSGKLFVAFMRSEIKSLVLSSKVSALDNDEGGFIVAPALKSLNYIVFDLEEAPRLLKLDDNGILLVLQKTLRFATKHWSGLKPSSHERIIGNGKAVVFPYPIGMQTELRVAIERHPDEKRRSKREQGSAMLVYKFSDDEGEGIAEVPRLTNFRKSVEAKDSAYAAAKVLIEQTHQKTHPGSRAIAVTALDTDGHLRPAFQAGLGGWSDVLTTAQLEFVNRRLDVPHRIEGPAGTGKTLCLVLKCLKTLKDAQSENKDYRALFVAHSEATKRAIDNLFAINDQDNFFGSDKGIMGTPQTLHVTTLQNLCAHLLHQEISESELVDRDAYESKMIQALYAREAIDSVLSKELESHKPFLSKTFIDFLSRTDPWVIAEMLRHEISVQIKGRADQDLNKYKKLQRLKNGLPIETEGDHAFVFLMYERYQQALVVSAQFDTDDVVLSAISQLNTPIWRRRRTREGYDGIFIDETHLFNLNELSVFHRLTRNEATQPIAYSVDKSQALGDRGWTNEAFDLAFAPDSAAGESTPTPVNSIFRCSPDIVNLAFSVTSSGATLFTNFHNPLTAAVSAFTADEERRTTEPIMRLYPSDEAMLTDAFVRADTLAREMEVAKADVVIIAFGDDVFKELQNRASSLHKPVEVVKSRGDLEAVNRARQSGRFVLTAPEFVGGLEFLGAVLVGVDGGRVPPKGGTTYEDSQNFLSYASHQRVYVALTRARFRVEILGTKARGVSSILSSAVQSKLLSVCDA